MNMRVLAGLLLAGSMNAADAPMNNQDVMSMVASGVSQDLILTTIRNSEPHFNLMPSSMDQMKKAGVPEQVIRAMAARQNGSQAAPAATDVKAVAPVAAQEPIKSERGLIARPATPVPAARRSAAAAEPPPGMTKARSNSAHAPTSGGTVIPSGTRVSCRLEQTISSATVDEGQQVQLVVTEDVKVGDVLLIAQGSPVVGTIVQSVAKRRMGRTGKLDFSIDKVRAMDGKFIPVRYSLNKKEGGSHALSTGVMTAGAAVLFFPAAPFFLLRKGKDVNINKGMVFEVFTDEDHSLAGAPVASIPAPELVVNAVAELVTITITADATGADIEIDGAFVGSTPSTRKLTTGLHRIVVRNGNKVWERALDIQAETAITVHARVAQQP
jgi:hypothetical protein